MLTRRNTLGLFGAGLAVAGLPRIAFAAADTDKRLVVVLLRGAMDGLSAAPPMAIRTTKSRATGLGLRGAGPGRRRSQT